MCKLCETKPVYEFTNQRKLCKTCFVRWFQKKVLYIIRKFEMISKDDIICYENKGDFRGVVLEDVLKMFAERLMIELVRLPSKKKVNKIARSSNTDLEADKIVHVLIEGKGKINYPKDGKEIFPLYLFLDKEILLYAKLRNLAPKGVPRETSSEVSTKGKFKKVKEDKDKISKFIDVMEKTHPEVKQAIVGSYLS